MWDTYSESQRLQVQFFVVDSRPSDWFLLQDAKAIQNSDEYEELKQVKGGIFFRTKKLKKAADKFADATAKYQKHQGSLVKEVVNIAG